VGEANSLTIRLSRFCSEGARARNSNPMPWVPVHRTVALLIVIGVDSSDGWISNSSCMPVKGWITFSIRQPFCERSFTDLVYHNLSLWMRGLGIVTGNRRYLRTTMSHPRCRSPITLGETHSHSTTFSRASSEPGSSPQAIGLGESC